MYDLFNWHNSWILIQQNLLWILLAFALGAWTGYRTCEPQSVTKSDPDQN